MNTDTASIKDVVRTKYAEIALQSAETNAASCCGSGGCCTEGYTIMADEYGHLDGYLPDADLKLGCGLPTETAGIRPGHTVLDLGSGAGNDCFIARHETGPEGRVIGVDFTPEMVAKARANAEKLGYTNVEFHEGDIEHLPLPDAEVDVVVSNCVLNLVPDKAAVFAEIHRVLKPGGHFSISDIVLQGELPDEIRTAAELYAGCVSGAEQLETYLGVIRAQGFREVEVLKTKPIHVPYSILIQNVRHEAIKAFRESGTAIVSITVKGVK